jgi:hypothetical protein
VVAIHELHASGKYASQVHCAWNWTGKLEMLLARVQNNTVWIAIKLSFCSRFPPFLYIMSSHLVSFRQLTLYFPLCLVKLRALSFIEYL